MQGSMENLSTPGQNEGPVRTENWDPRERTLVVETTEKLKPGLKEVVVQMTSGRIVVEGSEDVNPKIVTRLAVSAGSEAEARKYLEDRKDVMEVKKGFGSIAVDARGQEGVSLTGGNVIVGGRGVVVSGDLVGGVVIGGGEVWINGQRVDVGGRGGAQIVPGVEREVVLSVPKGEKLNYTLETQQGAVEIRKTGGEARVSTTSANIGISEYDGELGMTNRSGDVEIERFKGELSITATSGDVEIEQFDGTLNLNATSGDVKLGRATFRGRSNNIRATSGDVSVAVDNSSLVVSAETSSGKIRTPQGRDFVVTREDKPKERGGQFGRNVVVISSGSSVVSIGGGGGRSFVEGHFGSDPKPEDRLSLSASSGDITIR